MSIKKVAEERIRSRAACRAIADELLLYVVERIEKAPEALHPTILSMLISELGNVVPKDKAKATT